MSMTLEQVRDRLRELPGLDRVDTIDIHEMADAIDAQLRAAPISTKADKRTIDAAFQRRCSDEFKESDMSWRPSANSAFIAGWRAKEAHLTQSVDVDSWTGEIECCDAKGFWLILADDCPFVPGQKVTITAALQEKGNG